MENLQIKRTLKEWARETFGMAEVTVESNRRLITEFLDRFQPATDDVRDLRARLQQDAHMIFHVRQPAETALH